MTEERTTMYFAHLPPVIGPAALHELREHALEDELATMIVTSRPDGGLNVCFMDTENLYNMTQGIVDMTLRRIAEEKATRA